MKKPRFETVALILGLSTLLSMPFIAEGMKYVESLKHPGQLENDFEWVRKIQPFVIPHPDTGNPGHDKWSWSGEYPAGWAWNIRYPYCGDTKRLEGSVCNRDYEQILTCIEDGQGKHSCYEITPRWNR